jgi:hypothetical protein
VLESGQGGVIRLHLLLTATVDPVRFLIVQTNENPSVFCAARGEPAVGRLWLVVAVV